MTSKCHNGFLSMWCNHFVLRWQNILAPVKNERLKAPIFVEAAKEMISLDKALVRQAPVGVVSVAGFEVFCQQASAMLQDSATPACPVLHQRQGCGCHLPQRTHSCPCRVSIQMRLCVTTGVCRSDKTLLGWCSCFLLFPLPLIAHNQGEQCGWG